jgi:predicted ferric reductase
MSRPARVVLVSIGLGCLVYAGSPGPDHFIARPTALELREQLIYLTGVCTATLMVASMILSARLPWVSRLVKGLDKGYVVHKWTGILSTLFVMCHFLLENVPKWLVEAGIIPNPGELSDGIPFSELEMGLFESGVVVAQLAFYSMIVLVVMALLKKIPYHWFRKSHRFFPVVFLLGAYHGATAQLKESWLGSPGSFLLLLILSIGVVTALISLFKKIGASRTASARISKLTLHDNNILDLSLTLENKTFPAQPGQYAFLTFPHHDEPHPFSIASSDGKGEVLRFVIKNLGDFTSQLPNHLRVGQPVQVEGPYGEFVFNDACERQVWIAGGIGITPFMARLEYLANHRTTQPIDFWYATRTGKTESFPHALEHSCALSGVNFYHLDSSKKEYVTMELIKSKFGDLKNTSIWFCGPRDFAKCIRKDLKSSGFDMRHFHYDSFSMR